MRKSDCILKKFLLGDICKINSDSYSSKDDWTFVNYLDTGNITDNRINKIQVIDLQTDKLPSRARRKVKVNSILYSMVRPNQRHYGIVKRLLDNFLVSTGFAVIDVDNEVADPMFIYYYLTQPIVTEKLHILAEQSVSTYPSIKATDIENLILLLPNLKVQKLVANMISSLDDKIELNNQINHNLEQQAQAIFKSWFIDFEPFGGVMPDDWIEGKLGDFVEVKRGGSPRPIQKYLSESGLNWLKISDVTSLQSPYIINIKENIKESGLNKTVFLKSGALVLSNSATPGIPKFLDVDSCIHDGWLYFPKSKLPGEFLYLYFKHIRNDLLRLGNGSIFINLKIDIVKEFPVAFPDERIRLRFDDIVIPLFKQMRIINRESQMLSQLRNTLLPRLMSGELLMKQS